MKHQLEFHGAFTAQCSICGAVFDMDSPRDIEASTKDCFWKVGFDPLARCTAYEALIEDLRWVIQQEQIKVSSARACIRSIIEIADDGKHGDPYTDLRAIIIMGCAEIGERCAFDTP